MFIDDGRLFAPNEHTKKIKSNRRDQHWDALGLFANDGNEL
jgi:hypothetical protein